MPTTPVALDTRPLTDPVDPAAVSAYAREVRATGAAGSASALGVIIGAVAFGFVFLTFFATFIPIAASGGGVEIFGPLVIVPVLIVLGIGAWVVVSMRTARVRRWRLGRFAAANGMQYWPVADAPALPGMIFGIGHGQRATDVVRSPTPRQVDYANYQYTTGSGKNRTTHKWGYVAIRLDVPLPNIVLDATSNNGIFGSNLPASFDRHQRLSLEGDFDSHFSLYCPEGYEQDALYLFTPDIMARFIDTASTLDVEIVDDWLFLYAKRDFSTVDPATWAWLTSVVAAFQDKFAQWARWRDDRLAEARTSVAAPPAPAVTTAPAVAGSALPATPVAPVVASSPVAPTPSGPVAPTPVPGRMQLLRPPPGVAPEGRRLKRGVRWSTIIIIGAVVVFWIVSHLAPLLAR